MNCLQKDTGINSKPLYTACLRFIRFFHINIMYDLFGCNY
jgi:hypothetical protein